MKTVLLLMLVCFAALYYIGKSVEKPQQSKYCQQHRKETPRHFTSASDAVVGGFMQGFREGYCK